MWGGLDETTRFDITDFQLDPKRLAHGLGREYFDALTDPQFETVEEADEIIDDAAGAVVIGVEGDFRIYPLPTMRRHEIVNDVLGGRPFAIAYCPLAKLAAVYEINRFWIVAGAVAIASAVAPQLESSDAAFNGDDCPADLDADGRVGTSDLIELLGSWGVCKDPGYCPADLDYDNIVGVTDLLIVLGNWGLCP